MNRDEAQNGEAENLFGSILWLNAKSLGLVLGLLSGLALFIATNWLVIKGGAQVGPHLSLLSQYSIGYSVSFLGSLVGFAYAFAIAAVSGMLIGWIYSKIVDLKRH